MLAAVLLGMKTLITAVGALAFGLAHPASAFAQPSQAAPPQPAALDAAAPDPMPPPPPPAIGPPPPAPPPPPTGYANPPAYYLPSYAPPPDSTEPESSSWYGWQSLIAYLSADAALIGTVALATKTGSASELIVVAVGVRAHAGMIVHFAHGNWGRGAASLGLVAGGAATGSLIGGVTGMMVDCSGEMCGLGNIFVGGLIGLGLGTATGTVIDIAALAYDEPPEEQTPDEPTVSFSAVPTPDGLTFAAVGTF